MVDLDKIVERANLALPRQVTGFRSAWVEDEDKRIIAYGFESSLDAVCYKFDRDLLGGMRLEISQETRAWFSNTGSHR